MEMNKLLLRQAAEALENLRGAHHLLIEWYPKTVPKLEQLPLQDRLLEADRELFWQLMVAIPISALYAAQYAEEAPRYSRVVDLLNRCGILHSNLSEAFIIFSGATGANYSTRLYKQFHTAGKILTIAQGSLKQLLPHRGVLNSNNRSENAICVGRQRDDLPAEEPKEEAAPPTPAEYLRDRSPYEWNPQALCLKSYLTLTELDSLVVEKLRSPFQRFLRDSFPIYGTREDFEKVVEEGVEKQDYVGDHNNRPRCLCCSSKRSFNCYRAWRTAEQSDEESDEESDEDCDEDEKTEKNKPLHCFDSVNAVWYSMLAAACVEKHGEEEYRKIYRAATSVKVKVLATPHKRIRFCTPSPVSLAKGLRTLDVWLGVIFEDDPKMVLWPLGRSPTSQGREVAVYCKAVWDRFGGFYDFSYQGIKYLVPGQTAVRPPRVDLAFSSTRQIPLRWRALRQASDDSDSDSDNSNDNNSNDGDSNEGYPYDSDFDSCEKRSGPFDAGFLCSVLAIARQSSVAYKPFLFLRLPAELRNKVYEEYLSKKDWDLEGTRNDKLDFFSRKIRVPELCQTSHQLLSEVLPLYLAQISLQVSVTKKYSCFDFGAQPLLRKCLKFRNVEFDSIYFRPVPMYSVCYIGLSLTDQKPGFTISTNRWDSSPRVKPKRDPHPQVLTMLEQFRMFITILREDTNTDGLGLPEIGAIYEFLRSCERYRYPPNDNSTMIA